ncbi:glycosyltransferase family 2 protein [Halovivax cerinus]|uniref:Glycosyltransferase family 2 protein n=1 Tax=Halovivax cerinus TaxID=1487865 RepID=A0ABD5NMB3_9EURY|nr:glycosyltransferase family A protein [Halovivax cerinus]
MTSPLAPSRRSPTEVATRYATTDRSTDRELVSVVIPTHDRPARLRRAIRSVAAQTYGPIELIVVDDASSPPVSDDIDRVAARVDRFERHRFVTNRGGAAARNAGIEESSGEFIAFLDDDDRWDPAKLERQVPRLRAAPDDVGVVYTSVVQLDSDGEVNAVTAATESGDLTHRLLRRNVVGTVSSVLLRSDAAAAVGGFDERFPSWQDWALYLRLSKRYRFLALDEPLVVRHNAGAGQVSGDYETKRDETAPLFRRTFRPLAAREGTDDARLFDAFVEYHLGQAAIRAESYSAARRHFAAATRLAPRSLLFPLALASVACGRATYEPLERLATVLPLRRAKRALQR